MRQRLAEDLDELELELFRSSRRDNRVQLVEDRVFPRIVPAGDVFESELVLRRWNILAVKALLPFFDSNVVGAYESAGPTVTVFSRVEQPVRQVLDVRAHTDFLPVVADDGLGVLVVTPLRCNSKLKFHALTLGI